MDWPHTEEITRQHHQTGPQMEPTGQKSRGRHRNTWRRDTESELKGQGHNWNSAEKLAPNRVRGKGPLGKVYCNWVYNVLPFSKSSSISPNKLLQIISLKCI